MRVGIVGVMNLTLNAKGLYEAQAIMKRYYEEMETAKIRAELRGTISKIYGIPIITTPPKIHIMTTPPRVYGQSFFHSMLDTVDRFGNDI